MSNIVTIGYTTEGTTDQRFLETIIKNTVEEIAFSCQGSITVFDPVYHIFPKDEFVKNVLSIAQEAHNNGLHILCIHADADHYNDVEVIKNKFTPALKAVHEVGDGICKNIVPIIPITMSESWMLADKELFKTEIGTRLSDLDLNINRHPESIANPKLLIEEAIRVAQEHLPKRRDKITISELYQSIGQKISIDKLEQLSSFRKFKSALRDAFVYLNYLHS